MDGRATQEGPGSDARSLLHHLWCADTGIFSPLLYQLSYLALWCSKRVPNGRFECNPSELTRAAPHLPGE